LTDQQSAINPTNDGGVRSQDANISTRPDLPKNHCLQYNECEKYFEKNLQVLHDDDQSGFSIFKLS